MEKLEAVLLLITALTSIAAVTPTEKDDKIMGRLNNLVDKIKKILVRL